MISRAKPVRTASSGGHDQQGATGKNGQSGGHDQQGATGQGNDHNAPSGWGQYVSTSNQMSFTTNQTKNAGSSVGPAADTSKIGGEKSLQGTIQKLSAGLTPKDILPQGVSSWLANTTKDQAKAGGTLTSHNSDHGSTVGGVMTNSPNHQGATLSPNGENSLHNLNFHTF